jgi:hypothetical protein
MKKEVRICDRDLCGEVIKPNDRYGRQITIHGHHDRTIDLCVDCADAFAQFLTHGLIFGVDHQVMINGIFEASKKQP